LYIFPARRTLVYIGSFSSVATSVSSHDLTGYKSYCLLVIHHVLIARITTISTTRGHFLDRLTLEARYLVIASISFRLATMTSPNNTSNNCNPPTNDSILPASNSSSLINNQGSLANSDNNSINSSTTPILGSHSTPIDRTSWPADLVLDLGKSNWMEWSRKLSLLALQQGFTPWLDGSLPCPDATLAPGANFIWKHNDDALQSFIQEYVYPADVHLIDHLPTAHLMFETLRAQHERQDAFAQIDLLLKALRIKFTYEKSIRDPLAEVRTYYRRIVATGEVKEDVIFSVILLNAMNRHFRPLQQSIMCSSLNITSEMIITRLLNEDALIRRRVA
jgi:hypothetical protein